MLKLEKRIDRFWRFLMALQTILIYLFICILYCIVFYIQTDNCYYLFSFSACSTLQLLIEYISPIKYIITQTDYRKNKIWAAGFSLMLKRSHFVILFCTLNTVQLFNRQNTLISNLKGLNYLINWEYYTAAQSGTIMVLTTDSGKLVHKPLPRCQ